MPVELRYKSLPHTTSAQREMNELCRRRGDTHYLCSLPAKAVKHMQPFLSHDKICVKFVFKLREDLEMGNNHWMYAMIRQGG